VKHLAVLVSGNGSNLQAIIDACESKRLADTRVSVVVSNRKAAYALKRAAKHGIPTIYHPLRPYRVAKHTRAEYDADLASKLSAYPVDLVVMAGWMHIFTIEFLRHFSGRVINIHPALPGMFPGAHGIVEAFEAFQRGEIDHTGVMVHYVPDEGVDEGPVIAYERVPIEAGDTLDSVEARIHAVEHDLYICAIAQAIASQ